MKSRLPISRPRRRAALAATASAMVAAVGLGAPAAYSDPAASCPEAYPVPGLTGGAPVTGLTVTSGTAPETFAGSVVGVLEDGISPGVDMILVDLESATIDKVGIWSGMSGSPVYADDGRLIGAVSYSLGLGPSTIAGVTPAAAMLALLDAQPAPALAPRSQVPLTSSLRSELVDSGAVAPAASAATSTMSRLRVPVGMSGLGTERLKAVAPALNKQGLHVVDAPAGPTSSEPIGVAAGGNLVASMSYGTVTAAGIGTATAVCGDEVLGFGHPMNFSGPSTMSLHGARATHIQDDPTLSGFKVANIGAPVGTVNGDRLAGLHAVTGPTPASYDVTSDATDGASSATATSHVTMRQVLPDIGFANVLSAQDRALDRTGAGTAATSWTIHGLRKDGTPFSFTRDELYADPDDVSVVTAVGLAKDMTAIQKNPGEVVKITSVDTDTRFDDTYETYVVSKVQAYRARAWTSLNQNRPAWLRAGRTAHLRALLTSRGGEPRTVRFTVAVPARAAGRLGALSVVGGNKSSYGSDDFFFLDDEDPFEPVVAPSADTFPKVLADLTAGPQQNQVRATLRFRHAPGAAGQPRTGTGTIDRVVGGRKSYQIVALP